MFNGKSNVILIFVFIFIFLFSGLNFISSEDTFDVGVSVSNGVPEIQDVNVCEVDTCSKYIDEIIPGNSTFVLQVQGYDPNGIIDINWDATVVHIYAEGLSFDSNVDFDGNLDYRKYSVNTSLTEEYNGFIFEDGEGCTSSSTSVSEVKCLKFTEDIFTYGFALGGANIYVQIFDNADEDSDYDLMFLEDVNGLNIGLSLSFAIGISDEHGITYSGAPGDENVEFYNADNTSNYFDITNESNTNIDLNLSHTDLLYDLNNSITIDKEYIHGNKKDQNFGLGSLFLPVNLGIDATMQLKTYLDIPVGIPSGAYSGTLGVAITQRE